MQKRPALAGHNNKRHLSTEEIENNIGGLPVTDDRLRELFKSLDKNSNGMLSLDEVKTFYASVDHYGLSPSEQEIDETVRKYSHTKNNCLTYDEFCCLVLKMAQEL